MIEKINVNNQTNDILAYSTSEAYIDSLGAPKIKTNLKRMFPSEQAVLVEDGDDIFYGGRPYVPQTGTWQIKPQYANKKYVIFGTDDDNSGNTKVFRMLRTYGFPYKMNVECQNAESNKNLGSDVDECFTNADAPALFASSTVGVREVSQYLIEHPELGEVAQHGYKPMFNSNKLIGSNWNELYSNYQSQGGVLSEADLKAEIMEKGASIDIAQGASRVAEERSRLETALNAYVNAVGIWGGDISVTLDEGITINLKKFYDYDYPWRAHNYQFASTKLNQGTYASNSNPWGAHRRSLGLNIADHIDHMTNGQVIEFYTHWWGDFSPAEWRQILDTVKNYVDLGDVQAVTGAQYYAMGEFV